MRDAPTAVAALATAAILAACGNGDVDDEEMVARGGQLYDAHCTECHGGAVGGEISDLPPPHNAEGHTWHHSDCQIIETVLEGANRPGYPEMPAFEDELSEQDVRAILAFIKTWWEEDQREFQQEVTELECE